MHVRVRDFWHRCKPKHNDEQSYEAGHTKIHPLDVLEALLGVHSLGKKDARCEEWCYERADTLDPLSNIQADFRVARRTADGEEVVCTSFECAEASTNNKHGAAEAAERLLYTRGPEEKASDCENKQQGL